MLIRSEGEFTKEELDLYREDIKERFVKKALSSLSGILEVSEFTGDDVKVETLGVRFAILDGKVFDEILGKMEAIKQVLQWKVEEEVIEVCDSIIDMLGNK